MASPFTLNRGLYLLSDRNFQISIGQFVGLDNSPRSLHSSFFILSAAAAHHQAITFSSGFQIMGITVNMVKNPKVTVYYADIKLAASFISSCCSEFIFIGVRHVNQG